MNDAAKAMALVIEEFIDEVSKGSLAVRGIHPEHGGQFGEVKPEVITHLRLWVKRIHDSYVEVLKDIERREEQLNRTLTAIISGDYIK